MINATSGLYEGDLNCPSFSSLSNTSGGTTISKQLPSDAKGQFTTLGTIAFGGSFSEIACSNDASIKYINFSSGNGYTGKYTFYDSSLTEKGYVAWQSGTHYSSSFTSSFTITYTYGAGTVFKFKNLQSGNSGLEEGQVYYILDSNGKKALYLV